MKKWQWVLVILCSITFLMQGITVQAKEKEPLSENQTKPKVVKEGGVELHIKRFPLSRYQVSNEAANTKFKGSVVSLANGGAVVTQMTAVVVDTAMDELFNLKVIDKFANNITSISQTLYTVLKANFGKMLFVYAIGYIFYLALVKQRAGEAMKKGLLFLVVMVLGGWYIAHSGYVIKGLNALSTESQGKLMIVGNKIVDIANGQGNYGDSDKVQKGKEQAGTVSILRNVYFDMAVEKPFLLTNFGETSKAKINKQKTDTKLSRTDMLLSYKLNEEGEDDKSQYIKKKEIGEFENENVESGNVTNQWGQASFGAIVAIAFGLPFLGLALISYLLQYVAILIALVLPVMLLLSFIPQFANSFFVGFKSFVVVFLVKAVLAVLILVVYLISSMTDVMIPPTNFGMYVLNMLVVAIIFIVMILKRDKLVKFITAGKVQQVDGNLLQNVKKDMVEPAFTASKKTGYAGGVLLAGATGLSVKAGAAAFHKGRDMWNKYRNKGESSPPEGTGGETALDGRTKQEKEEGKQTLRSKAKVAAPRGSQTNVMNPSDNITPNMDDVGDHRNIPPSSTFVSVQEKDKYPEEARMEQTTTTSNWKKVPLHVYSDPQEEIERSEQAPKEAKVSRKKAVPPNTFTQQPIERKPSSDPESEALGHDLLEKDRDFSKSTILKSYAKQKRDKQ